MKRFTRFSVNTRNCQVGKQSVIKRNILRNWKIIIYCPLLQTTVLFAVPLKAAAKPSALRGQYERQLLVAKPPPAIYCRYCKIVDFAIELSIKQIKKNDIPNFTRFASSHLTDIKKTSIIRIMFCIVFLYR